MTMASNVTLPKGMHQLGCLSKTHNSQNGIITSLTVKVTEPINHDSGGDDDSNNASDDIEDDDADVQNDDEEENDGKDDVACDEKEDENDNVVLLVCTVSHHVGADTSTFGFQHGKTGRVYRASSYNVSLSSGIARNRDDLRVLITSNGDIECQVILMAPKNENFDFESDFYVITTDENRESLKWRMTVTKQPGSGSGHPRHDFVIAVITAFVLVIIIQN